MICPIWKDLFHKSLEWLQVHTRTVLWCLWCRWFCDMRDDEETTWIEKWATLLNSKHVETQFAIILSSSSSCVVDTHTKHTNSSEWRVKNWFNRIHNFLFPFLIYKNPSRENKNAQENDEERWGEASSITHTYAQTWKPGVWWCWWWLYK